MKEYKFISEEKEEEIIKFQQELYDLTAKYLRGDDPSTLFMCCGIMLKTCIEMYVSVLTDDAIKAVLVDALSSVPTLRKRFEDQTDNITKH
tara:strand:- start:481 stop:753 length:273 start_codon:yes stop_codon:yes gene_type:complete